MKRSKFSKPNGNIQSKRWVSSPGCNNVKALQEGYDYFVNQLANVPYPSVEAMQAVVAQIAETNAKARGIDAKVYVNDRYLKRLEDEGFVKKLWGR